MKKSTLIIGAALVVLAAAAVATRGLWMSPGAVAQAPSAPRTVPVDIAKAVRKPAPVFLEAQIAQAEGNVARDRAQLDGAERDVRRYTELVAKNATPVVNLDNAKTQADTFRAAIKADEGALQNLKVQLSYCTIRAPISGRISAAAVKAGNFARASDAMPLATINQISPIYVSFAVPQRSLADVRHALGAEAASVEAVAPGERRPATGQLTMIENTVDSATGMVTMRATMDNPEQILWPGALVTMRLNLRVEDAVVVPASAVLSGQ